MTNGNGPGTGFVYLAYPVDKREPNMGLEIEVNGVANALQAGGWGSYDPGRAFAIGHRQTVTREVASVNNLALGRSKGMIAWLPDGVVSIGVPMEIERAVRNAKPVVIVGGEHSWALGSYKDWPTVRVVWNATLRGDDLDWLVDQMETASPMANRTPLPVAKLGDAAQLPSRNHQDDAGLDLYVSDDVEVVPGVMVDVPCSLAVEIPEWAFGMVVGRSSTLRTKGLHVHAGIIDPGYRGELFAAVSTLGNESVKVNRGDRLAQLILLSNTTATFDPAWVERLSDSSRGTRGFGSSGP